MVRFASLLLYLASVTSSVAQERLALPVPTGPHAVGRTMFHWIDRSRPEVLSERSDEMREVAIWVWYPALPRQGAEPAPYVADLDVLATVLAGEEASLLSSVQTHSSDGARLAPEPARIPVLLFSPGNATFPELYTSYAEDLASHGYVVAVLDHPYDSAATRLYDGTIVELATEPTEGDELLAFRQERVNERSRDVSFVIQQLALLDQGVIDSPFEARLDFDRIGALGHSIGGMTAAQSCIDDARIRACANMDGVTNALPAYPDPEGRGPSQPFLFIAKPFPRMQGESDDDSQRRLAFLHSQGNTLLDDVRFGRSYRVTISGATHATFSDEEFLLAGGAERPRELLDLARAYLLGFFRESLEGQPSSLLSSPPIDGAIRVETFTPQ